MRTKVLVSVIGSVFLAVAASVTIRNAIYNRGQAQVVSVAETGAVHQSSIVRPPQVVVEPAVATERQQEVDNLATLPESLSPYREIIVAYLEEDRVISSRTGIVLSNPEEIDRGWIDIPEWWENPAILAAYRARYPKTSTVVENVPQRQKVAAEIAAHNFVLQEKLGESLYGVFVRWKNAEFNRYLAQQGVPPEQVHPDYMPLH